MFPFVGAVSLTLAVALFLTEWFGFAGREVRKVRLAARDEPDGERVLPGLRLRGERGGDPARSGGDDGLIRRWDAATGKQQAELRNDGPVVALAIRPDGRRLAAAGAKVLIVVDGFESGGTAAWSGTVP